MISIIDYGMGNIHSVKKALEICGAKTVVADNPKDLSDCRKIVLPGVGAFDDAVRVLEKKKFTQAIIKHIKSKKPFLGICLGMQILFAKSSEAKEKNGLGVLKGEVKRFSCKPGLKVPHMGWNQLKFKMQNAKFKNVCPLFRGIPDNSLVYF
jgi:glutamine amidotransferase